MCLEVMIYLELIPSSCMLYSLRSYLNVDRNAIFIKWKSNVRKRKSWDWSLAVKLGKLVGT